MADYGSAWVDLHVRTDKVPKETDEALHKLGRDAEHTMDGVGHDSGDAYVKGFAREVEHEAPKISDAVRRGLKRRKVKVTETLQYDRDNNVTRRWVKTVTQDIENAFADASGPGGPFNKAGQAAADAIGAGFNISGKSPLIALLVPLVGAIGALVGAALQAINALAAALTTLPALLASIGLQVGVLMLAFKGVGTAIGAAFAAKNAKELEQALKDLTPPAQAFVRALLPLKNFFRDLKMVAQANFFKFFGADTIPKIFKALGSTLLTQVMYLARDLGVMFRNIALFFASPVFKDFVNKLFPATIDFLRTFGPAFVTFISGLIQLGTASIPFLTSLGHMLSGTLTQLGVFFSNAAKDPATIKWFKDMQKTMEDVLELFGAAIDFVFEFLDALNTSGAGPELLQALAAAFEQLAFFFSTEAGRKSLKSLADSFVILTVLLVGFLETILLVIASVTAFIEFLGSDTVLKTLEDFGGGFLIMLGVIGGAVYSFFRYIGAGLVDFFRLIYEVTLGQIKVAIGLLETIYTWFRDIGKRVYKAIKDAFHDVGAWLYEQGRKLVRGFIDGIYSMLGLLADVGHTLGSIVAKYLPHSPAEEGPLSGDGSPEKRGKALVRDFGTGIKMASPDLNTVTSNAVSNISFGRDSVKVTFEGAVPTEQQARTTGSAVGSGILDKLAARNTRLAVRTL